MKNTINKHSINSPQNTLLKSPNYPCETPSHILSKLLVLVARQQQVSFWPRPVRCEESASF